MKLPDELMISDMNALPFVTWDRFLRDNKNGIVEVFGWIKREDTHEDFVLLHYETNGSEEWELRFSSSSAKYHSEIRKNLGCSGTDSVCERVEDKVWFHEVKSIKLGENTQK